MKPKMDKKKMKKMAKNMDMGFAEAQFPKKKFASKKKVSKMKKY